MSDALDRAIFWSETTWGGFAFAQTLAYRAMCDGDFAASDRLAEIGGRLHVLALRAAHDLATGGMP